MKSKFNLISFGLMHIGFLIYSCYALVGKLASKQEFLSRNFILLYFLVFVIMGIYAVLWQQVLKTIPLSVAIANKTITIIWGMFFGFIFFKEAISVKMILGAIVILAGIMLLVTEKPHIKDEK